MGGIKLGEGCVLVPSNVSDQIVDKLSAFGVAAKKLEMYTTEDQFNTWRRQRQTNVLRKSLEVER